MAFLEQQTVLILPRTEVARLVLSVPAWELLGNPIGTARLGLVRHGVEQAQNHIPAECKLTYPQHVQHHLTACGDPTGQQPRTILAWGTRNTFQNLGLPGWSAQHQPSLLCRPDEPWRHWTYQAFWHDQDGRWGIAAVRLEETENQTIYPRLLESSGMRPGELDFLITGQPLLWDGVITPTALLAAVTYDLRHVYHLLWEDWQQKRWPGHRSHKDAHDALMQVFISMLESPLEERAAAMAAVAARASLRITDHYLHSSLGVRDDGSLVLLIAQGTLTAQGALHQKLGSRRALLLDNGGSCGIAYYARRTWRKGIWADDNGLPSPVYLGPGSYFRPQGHALLLAELTSDIEEPPFIPAPEGNLAWDRGTAGQ